VDITLAVGGNKTLKSWKKKTKHKSKRNETKRKNKEEKGKINSILI